MSELCPSFFFFPLYQGYNEPPCRHLSNLHHYHTVICLMSRSSHSLPRSEQSCTKCLPGVAYENESPSVVFWSQLMSAWRMWLYESPSNSAFSNLILKSVIGEYLHCRNRQTPPNQLGSSFPRRACGSTFTSTPLYCINLLMS